MSKGRAPLMEITIPSRCYCGGEMTDLGEIDQEFINVTSIRRFVCKDCGRCIDITDYVRDDDENSPKDGGG